MEPQATWTSLEIVKLIVALLTPLVVAGIGYWFNRRLKEVEQANQARNRLAAQQWQERRDQIERRHEPHIEFTIDCHFFGPQEGAYLAELVLSAHNKSLVRHQFKAISLRARGLDRHAPVQPWDRYPNRVAFPELLFNEQDIKPEGWNYIFIEPGVRQEITFIARVEQRIRFVLAHAEFHYDRYTPHTIERMFEVAS